MTNLLLCVEISGDDRGDWIGAVREGWKMVPGWGCALVSRLPWPDLHVPVQAMEAVVHGDMNQSRRILDTFLKHARTAWYRWMMARLKHAGLKCHLSRVIRWEQLPTPRVKLNASFRRLPDEDLLVSGFDVVLRRKG